MTKRPYKPAGIPAIFPYLTVRNAENAIEFYEKAFGFNLRSEPAKNEEGHIQHAEMKYGDDVVIMFAPEGAYGSPRKAPVSQSMQPSIVLYVYCKDVDSFHKQAVEHGAKCTIEPNDSFWGDRFCALVDPDGHEWMFATNVADYSMN